MTLTLKNRTSVSQMRLISLLATAAFSLLVLGARSQVVFQANNTSGCTPLGVVISVVSPAASSITSYAWQITTPSGSVLTASTSSYVAIFSQAGAYDVSLTINGNQTQTINDYISVYSLPTANFTASDPIGCFPLCVDFSDISVEGGGDIVEWSWDFGDGGSSTQQNPNYCYTQTGTFTPVFSIEDEHGCFADITMPAMIHVQNNFPLAQFSLSTQLDCNPPVDITMTNTSTGTSALTSEWDFGDGGSQTINGIGATTHNYLSTGNFNVCLNVVDQIGCEGQVCHPVTIFGTAAAQFTVSSLTECEGEAFIFTNTTTPTPPTVAWDFNGDGVIDSNNPVASYSYANSGTYQPSLTVTYSGSCSDIESNAYTLNVIDGIDVDFVADTLASCSFPFTVNFDNLSTGALPISYEWYVNGLLAGTSTDLAYTFNAYGLYDIKLVASNGAGCVNEYIINDYILVQEPSVEFDNAVSVCTDQSVPVFNVNVTSVDPVQFYFWDFNSDGTTDAEGLTPLFMYVSPGTFNITLTIETLSGCTASYTNTQTINVLTQVSANFTTSTNITCAGQPVEFCVDEQPGNTFSWNFFDGTGWVIMPLSESCIVHDYADTGYYDLTLTVFNGACNVLQTFTDFIYVAPPVAIFEYNVICGDMQVDFLDISIGADSIVWDFGDGSPPLSDVEAPSHIYAVSGSYTVLLTAYATDSDCPDTQSVIVAVSAPDASLSFTPNNGCPPLMVGISNTTMNPHWDVSISNGDHINVDWSDIQSQWQVVYSHDGITQNFAYGNPNVIYWPTLSIEEGGYFDVTVGVVDANGCSASVFYDDVIHVSSNPDFASFTTTNIDVCNNVNINFQPDLSNLNSWQWIFSDGSLSTSENPFHVFNPPYNYNSPLSATLTATDSLGCTSTVTQTLNITLPPVIDFIAASDPSCIGDVVQFLNYSTGPAGTTYTWDFGDPASTDNTSTLTAPTHAFGTNGTYEVCLTADNGAGCIITECTSDAVHIVNPEVSFTYTANINNCLYGVQFENTTPGSIISSSWDFGDGQTGFGMMAFHTYPIGVYDAELTVINNYGCEDTFTVPDLLSYGNQIGPYTQVLDSADCAPFDAEFSAFNPADTYFTYFWDFNDGSGDPSGNTVTSHTYLQPGIYCPSIIMTDPNNCPILISCQDSIVVTEFVMTYSAPAYICFGDTLQLNIGNATSYSWSDMSDITPGAAPNEFFLHPFDDELFMLTGSFADCVRTDTIDLVVNDLPVVTLNMANSFCFGDSIVTLDDGLPNTPAGEYFIDGISSATFDPSWTPEQSYLVNYVYRDTFQCVNNASANVYIHSLPAVSFADLNPACEDAAPIPLNMATPAGGVYTFLGDTITTFDPSSGDGNYQFEYTFTDIYGCVDDDSAQLIVHPLPEPLIVFQDECQDIGLQVNNLSTIPAGSIAQTQWNFGPGGTDNNFQPDPVYYAAPGSYGFTLALQSDHGCNAMLDTLVVIHPVPQVSFTPSAACQNASEVFYDSSTIASGNIVAWIWNAEGQTISSPDSLQYAFTQWGELPLSLTPISDFGCDDTLTTNVVVHPTPVAELEFEPGCFGEENFFHANASIPLGGVVSQEWSFGDGHPNEFGSDADNLYDTTGSYQLMYTAISNLGCYTTIHDSITVYAIPVVDFTVDPNEMCAETPFMLFDLSSVEMPSEIAEWSWWLDGDPVSTYQNPELTRADPGTYDLTLSVTSNFGCSNDSTSPNAVTIYPRPTAGFLCTAEAWMFNPVAEITNSASADVTYWYYDLGDGSIEYFSEGEHWYQEPDTYYITQYVRNTFGCRDTSMHEVTIHPDMLVYVPNAFTPDANGHNEMFIPVISGFDLTWYEMKIFDRWGIEVFSSTDRNEGWDGTFKGGPLSDGSYTWTLDIRDSENVTIHHKTGYVMLLK